MQSLEGKNQARASPRLLKYAQIRRKICVFHYIMQHAPGYSVKYADLPAYLCVFYKPGTLTLSVPRHLTMLSVLGAPIKPAWKALFTMKPW
jgi:hypothetical protein